MGLLHGLVPAVCAAAMTARATACALPLSHMLQAPPLRLHAIESNTAAAAHVARRGIASLSATSSLQLG